MKIKDYFKIFQKITAIMILSAMFGIAGCGAAESDVGATKDTSEVSAVETVSDSKTEVSDNEAVDELPPFAYKTTEERMSQGKTDFYEKSTRGYASNQFLMVNEVIAKDFDGSDFVEGKQYTSAQYIKLKGTLYEIYYNGKPANTVVYFPGDDLPDGYEVKVTEDYELVGNNWDYNEEVNGIKYDSLLTAQYIVEPNIEDPNLMSYARDTWIAATGKRVYSKNPKYFDGVAMGADTENDCDVVVIKPGMYFYVMDTSLKPDPLLGLETFTRSYDMYQCLTKEDLKNLPEGVTLAEDVVHY